MLECKKVPSLVDLCVKIWVNNVWHFGDVGEIDEYLLGLMLPLCPVDQLMHVEKSTKGRDLSSVTDKLWKKFYEKRFGTYNADEVIDRMRKSRVSLKWMKLYEEKVKEIEALERIMQLQLQLQEEENEFLKSNKMEKAEIDFPSSPEEEEGEIEEEAVHPEEEEEEEEEDDNEEEVVHPEEQDEAHPEEEEEEEEDDDDDSDYDDYGYDYEDDDSDDYDYYD